MPDQPQQPAAEPSPTGPAQGFTTLDAVERVMGAGYVASRESSQASELKRLKGVASSLATVIDTAGAVVAEPGFARSAMSLANHACTMLRCDRASVGFLRGRTVTLRAISHRARVDRGVALARLLEEAMNESVDQGTEVTLPERTDRPVIARQHQALAKDAHPCVVTLPLRMDGEPVGALTLERDEPFMDAEIAAARMLAELVTPRLQQLFETDRWFGARAAGAVRRLGGAIVGERHTWAKLGALAGFALLVFALFVQGDHRVEAPCTLDPRTRAIVSAPFDSSIRDVFVDEGDEVVAGDPLLRLDDAELRLQLASANAQLESVLGEVAQAQSAGDLASETEARLRADQARADIDLISGRLAKATLRAPIGGTVIEGRWRERLGAPVRLGDELYRVAPLDELRVELRIDGRDVRHVDVGQRGTLATAAFPARRIGFVVDRVLPFAESGDGPARGTFTVYATLDERPEWIRTGMEGVGRVTVGERSYAWLWTHRAVEWLRLRLWL